MQLVNLKEKGFLIFFFLPCNKKIMQKHILN